MTTSKWAGVTSKEYTEKDYTAFEEELRTLINQYSIDSEVDTYDFVLAKIIIIFIKCLSKFKYDENLLKGSGRYGD